MIQKFGDSRISPSVRALRVKPKNSVKNSPACILCNGPVLIFSDASNTLKTLCWNAAMRLCDLFRSFANIAKRIYNESDARAKLLQYLWL